MIKKITKKNILVVVAHTDDETLGLGGTIARHSLMGDKVYGISMTDGLSSRNKVNKKIIKLREKASENAAKIIGLNWLKAANFPDNAIDTIPILKVIKIIEKVKTKIKPSLIYKGRRYYSEKNIDYVKKIKKLLKEEGYTIKGSKKALLNKNIPVDTYSDDNISTDKLINLKNKIKELKKYLNG